MNVKQASEATGTSSDTIRYYEKIGLIPRIKRDQVGNRQIDEGIIRRIKFARQMRAAGMSVKSLKKYIDLVDDDDDNAVEQKVILRSEVNLMLQRKHEIEQALALLTYKLDHYDDHMRAAEDKLTK
ncbi:MerR family transcriptional regulator [Fructilactobacillus myrtifloralis]|uniref:MerR family transcriptional regulator n=1 Tax=Fructilactobacillus myrtifloralis TaxID=2940301 RepID=A0ABY5BQJ1_9LACO|nr:MerR family transcriptional regulator [Fructilactobacillus myrtifloralis]USS84498.1 MerR family transcriptional regulator [Fructilactobacillus myrtifloralis]